MGVCRRVFVELYVCLGCMYVSVCLTVCLYGCMYACVCATMFVWVYVCVCLLDPMFV